MYLQTFFPSQALTDVETVKHFSQALTDVETVKHFSEAHTGMSSYSHAVILVACTCERMFKAALRYFHAAVILDQTLVLKISPLAVLASAW